MGNEMVTNACASYDFVRKQIVLFYQGGITDENLRDYLLDVIPKYMVPTVYHQMHCFPYNDNGKIDRKRLEEEYIL